MEQCRIDALAHADAMHPLESCGLVVDVSGKRRYVPCRNASLSSDAFVLHPDDYMAAEDMGRIVAVVHSHPDADATPSMADAIAHAAGCAEWWVIGGGEIHIMPRPGLALLGRVFEHGVLDCYTLIRDYYMQKRGVVLPDFLRSDEWWRRGENLYTDHFAEAGFVETDALQDGDVLLMAIGSPVPNHGAIWLDGDVILHHLYGRLSCTEHYAGSYRSRTTHKLRYKR